MNSKWDNLVMWDNISYIYTTKHNITAAQLREVKKVLNWYINNEVYNGYIKKNNINMNPTISKKMRGLGYEIDYNISAYPNQLPKKIPQDIFSILPPTIGISDNIRLKLQDVHSV
jgi:CO dehydrogenase/acetyl-CoA synthase delta subunit